MWPRPTLHWEVWPRPTLDWEVWPRPTLHWEVWPRPTLDWDVMQCYITLMRNCSQKFPTLEYRKSLIQTCWNQRVSIRTIKMFKYKQYYCTHSRVLNFHWLPFTRPRFSLDQLSRTLTRSTQFYYVKINARVDLVAIDLVTPSLKFHLMHRSISLFEGFGWLRTRETEVQISTVSLAPH